MNPSTLRQIHLPDGRIAVHDWPAAGVFRDADAPVLLLHGVLTHSFIFEPILPSLTDRYRVLCPDLLGCGDSELDSVERTPADLGTVAHARRWLELLDVMELDRVHLVAHDVGGGIAQLMVLDAPDRFLSLSLINPVGYDYWPIPAINALRTPFLRQLILASFDLGTLKALVRRGVAHPERLSPATLAQFGRPFQTAAGRHSFLRFLRALDSADLTDRVDELRRLSMPTLIVRGREDHHLSAEITRRLAQDIPGARLELLPDVGHLAMLEAPEALGTLLRAHIDHSTRSPETAA